MRFGLLLGIRVCLMVLCFLPAAGVTAEAPRQPAVVARIAMETPDFPLSISKNRRHLVDRRGRPFLLLGDAAWSLIVQLSPGEVDHYLRDRRRKGFNAIYVNLIEHRFSDQWPPWLNRAGEAPFRNRLPGGQLNLASPNEAYWRHVDDVLEKARKLGIVVIAFPAYVGYRLGNQGWAAELAANGVANSRKYGQWLGARYAGQANLIWAMGGDWGPRSHNRDITAEVNALALGIRSRASQLMTAHSRRNRSAVDDYGAPWLDINTTYAQFSPAGGRVTVPAKVRTDYARTPVKPFFFIEGYYENEHRMTPAAIRAQAYLAMLGGAFGTFYGNWPIWSFGAAKQFGDDPTIGWRAALDLPGAQDMVHLGDLVRSRPFARLVPDYAHRVLTKGYGAIGNGTYAACARAADGSTVVVYLPQSREIVLEMSRLSGSEARAWWYDPGTGKATGAGVYPTRGQRRFRPNGRGDRVLVLDNAALDLPPPGNPGTD